MQTAYAAEADPLPVVPSIDITHLTKEQVKAYVEKYATPLHVSVTSMLSTIYCEAKHNPDETLDATGQSNVVLASGAHEDSWGLVQIHLPAHRMISKAQAKDPDFAVQFMAEQFAIGNASIWTCWRQQHGE